MAQLLGQVATGTVVKLKEDGIPAEYLVLNHGNPSIPTTTYKAEGTWVIKIENATNMKWGTEVANPKYRDSDLDIYLEGAFYNKFDDATKKIILKVGIFNCAGYGGLFYRRVFCISSEESSYLLSRLKDVNPMDKSYFSTRSRTLVVSSSSYEITVVNKEDSHSSTGVSLSKAIRPVMVLDNNAFVLDDGTISTAPEFNSLPVQIMEGQSLPITWSAMDGATAYTLQRQVDGGEWTQVYSGADTTYTDTVPAGTTLQYQVQATIDGTAGAYGQSGVISVISTSALAISGEDSNLGTITNDITYAVNTDTGNEITLTRTVNGVQVANLTVDSGFSYTIPVMDLPTGEGTIVIAATVQASSGPVSATRTWQYTKRAMSFPDSGSPAQLNKNGQDLFPITLAEAVRVPQFMGGSLDKTLEILSLLMTAGAKIETGSYVGTGTYGADNPNTLTFGFEPKIVFLMSKDDDYTSLAQNSFVIFINGCSEARNIQRDSNGTLGMHKIISSWKKNTLQYYSGGSKGIEQFNVSGIHYLYVAIG